MRSQKTLSVNVRLYVRHKNETQKQISQDDKPKALVGLDHIYCNIYKQFNQSKVPKNIDQYRTTPYYYYDVIPERRSYLNVDQHRASNLFVDRGVFPVLR